MRDLDRVVVGEAVDRVVVGEAVDRVVVGEGVLDVEPARLVDAEREAGEAVREPAEAVELAVADAAATAPRGESSVPTSVARDDAGAIIRQHAAPACSRRCASSWM